MIYVLNDELAAQILTNMMDNSPPEVDTREGTPTYSAMAPIADELAQSYAELAAQELADFIVDEAGNVTMTGLKLDLFAAAWGDFRKPGGESTGGVFLYANNPTAVPAGTQVYAPATVDILFQTLEDVVAVPEGVSVPIRAMATGTDGDVSAGTITQVAGDLSGVITVINPTATAYGFNEEDDAEFAARFLNERRNEATSGNAAHYRQWAMEVPGIEDAFVIPVWNGPNTVKVIVLSSNRDAPSEEKIREVKTYIDSIRPVFGDADPVAVDPATEVPVHVEATVLLDDSVTLEEVQTDFNRAMLEYLETLAFGTVDTVRVVRLENALLDIPGIIDIPTFTVNGAEANIIVPVGSIAVKGDVTIHV